MRNEPSVCNAHEAWLAERATQPPKYKVALLTWIGIFPVITLLLSLLGPTLATRPVVVRAFVLTACAIPVMTWIVMPIVTRLTGSWLHAGASPHFAHARRFSRLRRAVAPPE